MHTWYLSSLTQITNRIFEFVILRRPLARVHGVLAGQPMTDGEAGLDSDWTWCPKAGK